MLKFDSTKPGLYLSQPFKKNDAIVLYFGIKLINWNCAILGQSVLTWT